MGVALLATLSHADGNGGRRGGRRRGRNGQRAGRQQPLALGPPPQPIIDIPEVPAAPLPVQNRFVPTGPAPGSALPPESPVVGHIPDGEGNYDFT